MFLSEKWLKSSETTWGTYSSSRIGNLNTIAFKILYICIQWVLERCSISIACPGTCWSLLPNSGMALMWHACHMNRVTKTAGRRTFYILRVCPSTLSAFPHCPHSAFWGCIICLFDASQLTLFTFKYNALSFKILHVYISLGNVTGYPGVFQSNPHPYPSKPVPTFMGMGFHGHRSRVYKNPQVPQPAWGCAFRDDQWTSQGQCKCQWTLPCKPCEDRKVICWFSRTSGGFMGVFMGR